MTLPGYDSSIGGSDVVMKLDVRCQSLACIVAVSLLLCSCVTDSRKNFFEQYPSQWEKPSALAGDQCSDIDGVYRDAAESANNESGHSNTLSGMYLYEELPEGDGGEIYLHYDSNEGKLEIRSHEISESSGTPQQIRIIDDVVCKSGWLEFYEDYSGYGDGTLSKGGVKTYFTATSAHLVARYEGELFTSYIPLFKTRYAAEGYVRFEKVMMKAE